MRSPSPSGCPRTTSPAHRRLRTARDRRADRRRLCRCRGNRAPRGRTHAGALAAAAPLTASSRGPVAPPAAVAVTAAAIVAGATRPEAPSARDNGTGCGATAPRSSWSRPRPPRRHGHLPGRPGGHDPDDAPSRSRSPSLRRPATRPARRRRRPPRLRRSRRPTRPWRRSSPRPRSPPGSHAQADPSADAAAHPEADSQAHAHPDPEGHAQANAEANAQAHAEADPGTGRRHLQIRRLHVCWEHGQFSRAPPPEPSARTLGPSSSRCEPGFVPTRPARIRGL